jgi:prefoldin subunit 5
MEQKAQVKVRAPDNNKRLAGLEASVSSLAIALTANGITLEEGADPIVAAIVAIKAAAESKAALTAALAGCNEEVDKLQRTVDELGARAAGATPGTDAAELEELRKRVAELETENGELQTDVDELANAKNALANQLAADGKGTGEPPAPEIDDEPEDVVPVAERTADARDVGPEFQRLSEVAIAALVAEGGDFELGFSNGEFEIIELAPVTIGAGDLTRVDSSRFIVGPPVHIRGADAPLKIAGVGLLYAGEQVSYCSFEPAVVLHPGQERGFNRALIFG